MVQWREIERCYGPTDEQHKQAEEQSRRRMNDLTYGLRLRTSHKSQPKQSGKRQLLKALQ